MNSECRAALAAALGADAVEEHAPIDLDGVPIAATLRPADGGEVAAALVALARAGGAVVVRGGGNRLGFGHPPVRADSFLSTERIAGVIEFDPDEGVCHVRGGTPLSQVRECVGAEGWELPLDPPGATSTVGGALAAAAVGPRTLGFGLPRDQVLGLEVVLANGERTHCGGRVVKNVTGYDLNKLYTGSFGTLGVIEGAWLRLRPRPERALAVEATLVSLHDACAQGVAAARRAAASVAALIVPGAGAGARLVVELAGDEETVSGDADALARELGAAACDRGAVDGVRELQAAVPGPPGLRFRISALPSRLEPAVSELTRAGAAVLAYPGLGLVYAGFPLAEGDENAADRAFRGVARVAREAGGAFLCEHAPTWAKRERDIFGALGVALPLIKTLKAGFDPEGVLNPGRFVGHI